MMQQQQQHNNNSNNNNNTKAATLTVTITNGNKKCKSWLRLYLLFTDKAKPTEANEVTNCILLKETQT